MTASLSQTLRARGSLLALLVLAAGAPTLIVPIPLWHQHDRIRRAPVAHDCHVSRGDGTAYEHPSPGEEPDADQTGGTCVLCQAALCVVADLAPGLGASHSTCPEWAATLFADCLPGAPVLPYQARGPPSLVRC